MNQKFDLQVALENQTSGKRVRLHMILFRDGRKFIISGAQTAYYSLNPYRDIPGPLAINPAYIRLAQASGQSYHSSGQRLNSAVKA
jgi:hypothetical protein